MACWKGPVEILKVTHASYGIEACLRQHMCGPHEDATGFQMNQTSEQNNTWSLHAQQPNNSHVTMNVNIPTQKLLHASR